MKKKEVDPTAEEAVEKAFMDSTSSPKLESAQSSMTSTSARSWLKSAVFSPNTEPPAKKKCLESDQPAENHSKKKRRSVQPAGEGAEKASMGSTSSPKLEPAQSSMSSTSARSWSGEDLMYSMPPQHVSHHQSREGL